MEYYMIKLKKLKRNQISLLRKLNSKAKTFNTLNEDFFHIYDSLNFIEKLIFKRNLRFVLKDDILSGYIWYDSVEGGTFYLQGFYFNEDFINSFKKADFNLFLLENKIDTIICSSDGDVGLKEFLDYLDFKPYDESIELIYDLDKYSYDNHNNNLKLEIFEENTHEEIRCNIQNSVFHNENRTPLTLKDIYMEEEQDYYIPGSGIFVKKDEEYVGYGQIIRNEDSGTIVNVGILQDYRGNGYGKFLINSLLEKSKELGFKKIKIKTHKDNIVALNLYKSMGFIEEREIVLWRYNKKELFLSR